VKPALLVALLLVSMTGCGNDGEAVTVTDARIGETAGPNAAIYLTAASGGGPDRLLGASTDAAASAELHETVHNADGTMGMRPLQGLELPAGGELVLEPGGHHIMLVDVTALEAGDTVEVVLVWEMAGEMMVEATVVKAADAAG